MSKRNYNVFFNTHTVSGIVISVLLYIIFLAGAFTIFMEEIILWESSVPQNHGIHKTHTNVDYHHLVTALNKEYDLTGRDVSMNLNSVSGNISLYISASQDSITQQTTIDNNYFIYNASTGKLNNYVESYTLGEFLYRLHFLSQIPYIGVYLSGVISLFFLFAITTGVIVHWRKIIPNFYTFNPRNSLKRIWTEAHTALGIIGLPFQFIYAVTGAYFCLGILVLIPGYVLYGGDQSKMLEEMSPTRKVYTWESVSELPPPDLNDFVADVLDRWEDFHLTKIIIRNYRGSNMKYVLKGEVSDKDRFIGIGYVVYNPYTGTIESERDPSQTVYHEDIQRVIGRLHFADFGGKITKLVYFLLALITCFVIISGILIYVESRTKKSRSLKERLYTAKVGHIYMAICLSMLPITAMSFHFVKLTNGYFINKKLALFSFYFVSWLVLSIFFRFKRNHYYTNKISLVLTAIFGLLIPVINGVVSGHWIWNTYNAGQYDILLVDLLWIGISLICLLVYYKLDPKINEKSNTYKYPIDYKNLTALKKAETIKQQSATTEHIQDEYISKNENHIDMRLKVVILWLFLGIGWIIHHIYGLFNIYYNETLMIDGATGEAPMIHHIFRILFEGLCLFFGLLTLEISAKWFKWTAFVWACMSGLYNVYHLFESLIYHSSNISEIFMLVLMVIANFILIKTLNQWRKWEEAIA